MNIEHLLACPSCAGELERGDGQFRCLGCSCVFPIRYGIPDFRLMPDPYISVEAEMAKIDGFLAPGRSFADMVRAYYVLTPESPPTLHQRYMAAMDAAVARGGGIISKLRQKFPAAGTGAMLDLGCGTGGMTIAGTRAYQTVVGVDVALRWLVMGKQRLEEAHIDAPLICANAESLPFKAEVFDAVVADSVLEHVRNSERMRDEALRVLMPGGAWFFVTNNRYSILPEPHLRLWGFGLLPRRVMEQLAWRLRATPYKARLHSRSELRRLFASYGEIMLPYYDPGELGPRNERIRQLWERLRKIGIVRYLGGAIVPQYFISGSRPPSRA